MSTTQKLLNFICFGIISYTLSGCMIGFLLNYKEVSYTTLYRSSNSKKNYFIITGVTYNHCGCTHLYIANYKNKKKAFSIVYDGIAKKTAYTYNKSTSKTEEIGYKGTSSNVFKIPFDSTEVLIFKVIDSLVIHRPRGTYPIKKNENKGYFLATDY